MIQEAFNDARVLVTGHTGFKGSWLASLLNEFGAKVVGLSHQLPSDKRHSYFSLGVSEFVESETVDLDIRDFVRLSDYLRKEPFDYVFHLAARAIVSDCLQDPIGAYATNTMGLAHVLEAYRNQPVAPTIVLITSDKCYLPDVSALPYKESHQLGGEDPYSASKAAAEIVAHSMFQSYPESWAGGVATARAGNVFGGGDWSINRLVPDIIRMLESGDSVRLRMPHATRPWTYVIDVVYGYALLAASLKSGKAESRQSWNFASGVKASVEDFARLLLETSPEIDITLGSQVFSEVDFLELDSTKSRELLGWAPILDFRRQVRDTFEWYRLPGSSDWKSHREKYLEPYLARR